MMAALLRRLPISEKRSNPHVSNPKLSVRLTPNPSPEPISHDDLVRSFTLSLGASVKAKKTQDIYEKSTRMRSSSAQSVGQPTW